MTLLAKFKLQDKLGRNKTAVEQSQKILLSPVCISRKGRADMWPLSGGDAAGHIAPSWGTHNEMFAAVATLAPSPTASE